MAITTLSLKLEKRDVDLGTITGCVMAAFPIGTMDDEFGIGGMGSECAINEIPIGAIECGRTGVGIFEDFSRRSGLQLD